MMMMVMVVQSMRDVIFGSGWERSSACHGGGVRDGGGG